MIRGITISPIKLVHVALNAVLQLLNAGLQFVVREVPIAIIHGFEFAAINRHAAVGEHVKLAAYPYELPAHLADGVPIISAKISDGFGVGRQSTGENGYRIPTHFNKLVLGGAVGKSIKVIQIISARQLLQEISISVSILIFNSLERHRYLL
jgi:hypothetical protein